MTVLNLQVAANGDDGIFGISPNSYFGTADTNALVGYAGGGFGAWFRFTGVSGLSGRTISSAILTIYGHAADTGTPLTKIRAERANAPANPSNQADAEARTKTTAKVDWDSPGFSAGVANTKDITTVIQELADNQNPTVIQIFWEDDGSSTGSSNFAQGRSYNNSGGAYAAKLDITHVAPSATGTGALTQPKQTLAGSGKQTQKGTSALRVPMLTLTGVGKAPFVGTSSLIVPIQTLTSTGKKSALGTGALSVPVQIIAASGTYTPTAATGTGTITVPVQTLAGVGRAPHVGTGAFRIPALTLTGSGKQIYKATGAFTMPVQVLAATGKQTMKATGAFTVPMLRLAGSGKQSYIGTGAFTLPVQVIAASGHMTFIGTGTLAIPMLVLTSTGQISLPPFVLCEFILAIPQYISQLIVPSYVGDLTVPNYNGKLTIPAEELIHNLSSMAEVRSVRGN